MIKMNMNVARIAKLEVMMSKRRFTFLLLISSSVIILFFLYFTFILVSSQKSISEVWLRNWNIALPEPVNKQSIIHYPGRDPVQYLIVEFAEDDIDDVLQHPGWMPIGAGADYVSSLVDSYKEQLLEWYRTDQEKIERAFMQHAPSFGEGDFYIVSRKADGSKFIAILNVGQCKLYSLVYYM